MCSYSAMIFHHSREKWYKEKKIVNKINLPEPSAGACAKQNYRNRANNFVYVGSLRTSVYLKACYNKPFCNKMLFMLSRIPVSKQRNNW